MTSPEVGRGAARAARRVINRQADRLRDLPDFLHYMEVVAVTSAGVTTVRWRGADVVAANKNALYAPAVGDLVLCALVQNRITVVCPLDGQP